MDKTLYDLMDWLELKKLSIRKLANPHRMLGAI